MFVFSFYNLCDLMASHLSIETKGCFRHFDRLQPQLKLPYSCLYCCIFDAEIAFSLIIIIIQKKSNNAFLLRVNWTWSCWGGGMCKTKKCWEQNEFFSMDRPQNATRRAYLVVRSAGPYGWGKFCYLPLSTHWFFANDRRFQTTFSCLATTYVCTKIWFWVFWSIDIMIFHTKLTLYTPE